MLRSFSGGQPITGGEGARGVAAGVVEEHAAAGFTGKDGVVVLAAGEVVPALRADEHLAGGALVVEGFGNACAFGLGDAVVVGENSFAFFGLDDERAEGFALGLDACDGGGVAGVELGSVDAGRFEGGRGLVEEGRVGIAVALELIGALEGVQLFVFQARNGLLSEGDFVLEGNDLRGACSRLHLLAQASDFPLTVLDVGLLRAAEDFFLLQRGLSCSEGDLSLGAGGLGGSYAERGFGELGAEALQFEILRLKDDEMFEVGVHRRRIVSKNTSGS